MTELERKPLVEFVAPVVEVIEETPTTKTLVFDLRGQEFDFYPGQYVMLKVPYPPTGEELKRAYSIASSPLKKDRLELTVKRKEGGKASVFLTTEVKEGDRFYIKGPYGRFYWTEELSTRIVLIGAGSGIVPLMSILRYIRDKELKNVRATLLVSYTSYEEIIYRKELQDLSRHSNIKVRVTLTRSAPDHWDGLKGRIDANKITNEVEDIPANLYYICGPPLFVDDMKALLLELGVDRKQIKTERYD
ncbi:ferredoxin-NADP reductase [Hydrogenivirga caldilitoris]|uniref:Ferredoxin-NADP reductase n=1 Tax=Hydrogenivirga caldilitoris TaxID=246264 RepID=A0A497XPM8_9AQUI|nr:ferredoxin reductase [Hydrogenivirga caldilitoris]RLJ70905.1 ferredoxin-NADP reductase [Hydrogenivirga caldilitoris]